MMNICLQLTGMGWVVSPRGITFVAMKRLLLNNKRRVLAKPELSQAQEFVEAWIEHATDTAASEISVLKPTRV